tara:strand:- start:348 stop:572 length:225 start_codon:yes stop_codon:yes gene_type:complete
MKPEDKIILRWVLDLYEKSFEIQQSIDRESANLEQLCGHLYQLFVQLNPVVSDDEQDWEDYREQTIKYINGEKK